MADYGKAAFDLAQKNNTQLAQRVTKEEVYGNQSKIKGISVTIDNAYTTALVDGWASQMSDVNCEIELVTLEFITDSNSINFTPYADMLDKITYIKNKTGKTIRMLKPHIVTQSGGDSFYRGNYLPTDMAGFFTNWTNRMKAYAQICKDLDIPVLCICCEQTKQTTSQYVAQWKTLITEVKKVNPKLQITTAYTRFETGRDLYEYNGIESLLDNVDILGLNYYPFLLKSDPSKYLFGYYDPNGVQTYNNNGLIKTDDQITHAKYKFNKPIYITEIGCTEYSNLTSTEIEPVYLQGSIDTTNQQIYTEEILRYSLNNKNIDGVFLWHISSPFNVLNANTKVIVKKYFN